MKPNWIARQSRRPSGWVGEVVARVMARDTHAANAFALRKLPVAVGGAVLEVGCGHGQTLAELAGRGEAGFLAGVDPSDVMVRLTTRRLQSEIARDRAAVHRAEAAQLPFEDACFDTALAVHVLYFWPEPATELREIRRVLRGGGTLVLGFRPDSPESRASLPASVYHMRSVPEVEKLLREAGFAVERVEEAAVPFVCVTARALDAREAPPPSA